MTHLFTVSKDVRILLGSLRYLAVRESDAWKRKAYEERLQDCMRQLELLSTDSETPFPKH